MTLIQDQIEKSRMFTTGHDAWEHYRRAALIDLDREGFDTIEQAARGQLSPAFDCETEETKKMRFRAWTNESLIYAIDRIRENRNAEALRGFIQACEYNARVNGSFYFYPTLHDAMFAVRAHFERLLKGAS